MRVPPTLFDGGYYVRGSKATRVVKKSVRTAVLRFIDLQKPYDSVDRTLLWQMPACFGVPLQMIEAIRQFHDGIRA